MFLPYTRDSFLIVKKVYELEMYLMERFEKGTQLEIQIIDTEKGKQ